LERGNTERRATGPPSPGGENCNLASRSKGRKQIEGLFDNRIPRIIFGTRTQKDAETLKIQSNEELHNLHTLSDTCAMFKSRRME
jgi:hypothetical protein